MLGRRRVLLEMRPFARPSVASDPARLAPHIREADRLEVAAASGMTALEALEAGLRLSREPLTYELDGEPIAMLGVAPYAEDEPETGVIWLLGSDALTADRRWFLAESRRMLRRLAAPYALVGNAVDARYVAAGRWLLWLGFVPGKMLDRYGVEGRKFVPMWRRVPDGWRSGRSEVGGRPGRRAEDSEAPGGA